VNTPPPQDLQSLRDGLRDGLPETLRDRVPEPVRD
jgi:hypothetical protein